MCHIFFFFFFFMTATDKHTFLVKSYLWTSPCRWLARNQCWAKTILLNQTINMFWLFFIQNLVYTGGGVALRTRVAASKW
jgi:hypothetical protein